MKRILFILVLTGFLGLWTSHAVAETHSHHHENHAVSPFDSKETKNPAFCLLMKHVKERCPHHSGERSSETTLSSDCGNTPLGTGSSHSPSGNSLFVAVQDSGSNNAFLSQTLSSERALDLLQNAYSIDTPPRIS